MSLDVSPDRQRLLRASLRGNATFSTVSGLAFVAGSVPIARVIGLEWPALLLTTGVVLLGFAAFLMWLSSRPEIPVSEAMGVVWMDLVWVAGTLPVIMADVLNATGAVAAVIVADVVLAFAVLQYLGIRRSRRDAAVAEGASSA